MKIIYLYNVEKTDCNSFKRPMNEGSVIVQKTLTPDAGVSRSFIPAYEQNVVLWTMTYSWNVLVTHSAGRAQLIISRRLDVP